MELRKDFQDWQKEFDILFDYSFDFEELFRKVVSCKTDDIYDEENSSICDLYNMTNEFSGAFCDLLQKFNDKSKYVSLEAYLRDLETLYNDFIKEAEHNLKRVDKVFVPTKPKPDFVRALRSCLEELVCLSNLIPEWLKQMKGKILNQHSVEDNIESDIKTFIVDLKVPSISSGDFMMKMKRGAIPYRIFERCDGEKLDIEDLKSICAVDRESIQTAIDNFKGKLRKEFIHLDAQLISRLLSVQNEYVFVDDVKILNAIKSFKL